LVTIKRKNMSESYSKLPRITSTHDRYYYDMLVELSDLIDFNLPIFNGKSLRNRSLGSVQTLLVEMALQNDDILDRLRKYMVLKGDGWTPVTYHNMKRY
jgi:hypothetical protein